MNEGKGREDFCMEMGAESMMNLAKKVQID